MRDFYRGDPDGLAEEKRRRMERRLIEVLPEMPEKDRKDFLDYYCEHTEGSSTIKAEEYRTFNVKTRAERWMARNKAAEPQKPKSRMQEYKEGIEEYNKLIDDLFKNGNGIYTAGPGDGYDDSPDIQ